MGFHDRAVDKEKAVFVLTGECIKDLLGADEAISDLPDSPDAIVNVLNGELWINPNGALSFGTIPSIPPNSLLPFEYDPEAKCPKFDEALLDIFANSSNSIEMVRHFEEFVGYVIQPTRDIPHFALFIGRGANGKTKLLETIQKLLGLDATFNDSITKFMRDNFNIAYLQGKLAFIDDDVSEGTVLDDGLIKKISESKTVSARRAYGRVKTIFVCRAIPIIAGNNYPKSRDISGGMVRRAMVSPFNCVFPAVEQDVALFPAIWEGESVLRSQSCTGRF